MTHGDRPCGSVLVPIPDHMPEARAEFIPGHPEYGVDGANRLCFRIDACIEPALRAVWGAGYKTLGCCCGHGQEAGGIITIDTGTYSATPRTGAQERFAEIHEVAVESMQRVTSIPFGGDGLLPGECQRCTGRHGFGETCADAAMRVARERGLIAESALAGRRDGGDPL